MDDACVVRSCPNLNEVVIYLADNIFIADVNKERKLSQIEFSAKLIQSGLFISDLFHDSVL